MPNDVEKAVLDYEQERLGRFTQVVAHHNADESLTIPVALAPDSPERGLSTYATIGLSQYDNSLVAEDGTPIRVELPTSGREEYPFLGSGLANAALNIASGQYQAKPGLVFPGVFDGYSTELTAPHGLLWYPFPWGDRFDGLDRDGLSIEWLLVIAITQREFDFIAENGPGFSGEGVEKLIDAFERRGTDIYDLTRASAV